MDSSDSSPARRVDTPSTKECYRKNHQYQTLDFVLQKKQQYSGLTHATVSIWDMLVRLDEEKVIDESDPDISLSQLHHAFQVAEGIRQDGHPDWMILTGLVHDLGKVLILFGEPQWAAVGDIFPVGCRFETTVKHPELFELNPDVRHPIYSTPNGIYEPGCGLDAVHFSMSHDWYLSHVLKGQCSLPPEALYVIRYHSFYAGHQHDAYKHLWNNHDQAMMKWVRLFQPYDLYTKHDQEVNVEELRPYYMRLIEKFIPGVLQW